MYQLKRITIRILAIWMRHLTETVFDIGRTQCMVGVDNESKHDSLVTQKHQFGFLPLDTLQLYTGDPIYYETIPDIISTHLMVRASGVPNFLKCLVTVKISSQN